MILGVKLGVAVTEPSTVLEGTDNAGAADGLRLLLDLRKPDGHDDDEPEGSHRCGRSQGVGRQ